MALSNIKMYNASWVEDSRESFEFISSDEWVKYIRQNYDEKIIIVLQLQREGKEPQVSEEDLNEFKDKLSIRYDIDSYVINCSNLMENKELFKRLIITFDGEIKEY